MNMYISKYIHNQHIHTCINIYIYIYILTCINIYIYMWIIWTYINIYINICSIRIFIYTCTCVLRQTCTDINTPKKAYSNWRMRILKHRDRSHCVSLRIAGHNRRHPGRSVWMRHTDTSVTCLLTNRDNLQIRTEYEPIVCLWYSKNGWLVTHPLHHRSWTSSSTWS